MPRVWVSVGSNIDREHYVRAALNDLRELFGDLVVSPIYETEAVGFDGDAFLNLVVGFDTELPPSRLHGLLRAIEARHGRERGAEKFAARTLDLDLLTYGDAVTAEGGKQLPRDEILHYAFVLAPLADVAGDELHPQLGESYRSLWQRFAAADRHGLRRLDMPSWLGEIGRGAV
ncbi:MAG: 2-amino-4-hydroxy-6-hydroxymethyldihydropteridine diphosphokinase [Chromatiaceae bacterium]|jgi:2-amino-4-hydroxy-6-hydroxymethyldihydropteridine diphosphokinase|nr:2-amino-4-hydroxy-6-hydroxymethyldihydropteridine diphosphokinase [Chromatiaceae bacterium]